jgi:hypothetical protein
VLTFLNRKAYLRFIWTHSKTFGTFIYTKIEWTEQFSS